MKRIILATLVSLGISSIAAAQTSDSTASNSSSESAATTPKSKAKKGTKANQVDIDSLNNRKVYHWKDGQKATPTGHEATGTNGGYAALTPDTSAVIRDSTRKQ